MRMVRILSPRSRVVARKAAAGDGSAGEASLRDVLPKPHMPAVRGSQTVTAILPNGRVTWIALDPAPASAAELERLRRAIHRADVYHAAGLQDEATAIRRLRKRVTTDLGRLGKRRERNARTLEQRRLTGDEKRAERLAVEVAKRERAARKQWASEGVLVRRRQRRDLWDAVVIASATPLFAAYGQRSDPFAEHNLALTLSLGVWLLGDELSDLVAGPRRLQGAAVRDLDVWSYVAPLGNLLTGWWLLADRQHERFVTGVVEDFSAPQVEEQLALPPMDVVAEVPLALRTREYRTSIDLAPYLASGHVDDFRSFGSVPAVATLVASEWDAAVRSSGNHVVGVWAEVELGILTITVTIGAYGFVGLLHSGLQPKVAWMVDTREPSSR
jgi:hypothetical protein